MSSDAWLMIAEVMLLAVPGLGAAFMVALLVHDFVVLPLARRWRRE